MSTVKEKIEAQRRVFDLHPELRHLIGPVELEAALRLSAMNGMGCSQHLDQPQKECVECGEAANAQPKNRLVALRGGTELTPEQCKAALDEAMTIIEAVGTTGIYTRYQKAHQWMNRYYPAWA